MSVQTLMVNHADILERAQGKDRLGQPLDQWLPKKRGVQCRVTRASGTTRFTDRSQGTVVAEYTLYFPVGTMIAEADRITNVLDGIGNVIVSEQLIPLLVRPVMDGVGRAHHIEVPCRVFRGLDG